MKLDKEVDVLLHLRKHPKMIQSNYVRDKAQAVAMLASCGLITTFDGVQFGKHWMVTEKGINELHYQLKNLIGDK